MSNFHSYPIRWYICFVISFINALNAYIWLGFSPVANHFTAYYNTTENILNYSATIFPLTTIIFGLPAALLIDFNGPQLVLISCAILHFIASVFRLLSTKTITNFSPSTSLTLYIIGQVIASFGQPLCMFVPTRLALLWFPDKQRATAIALSALGNLLGVMLNSLFLPLFIKSTSDIPLNNWATFGLSIFASIISIPASLKNAPEICPSHAARDRLVYEVASRRQPRIRIVRQFVSNCKQPFKMYGFWLLLLQFGFALAYFTLISTLLQQMLCTKGYSNQFAGLVSALMIVGGLVLGTISGYIVDKTGYLLESVIVCYCTALLGGLGFAVAIFYTQLSWLIMLSLIWLGTFGMSSYSLSFELAAEATYPIPEAITTGLLVIFSQICTAILIPLIMLAGRPDSTYSVCGDLAAPMDYSIPNLVVVGLGVALGIFNCKFLRMPYKRRELSQQRHDLHNDAIPIFTDDATDHDSNGTSTNHPWDWGDSPYEPITI